MGHVQVFSLYGGSLSNALLDSVGNLKYLRHFRVSGRETSIFSCRETPILLVSVLQLFNLRTLDLRDRDDRNLAVVPKGIGRLINFQILPEPKLNELSNLNNIRGDLRIQGLDNVSDVEEAEEANLQSRSRLQVLRLLFDRGNCRRCEHEHQTQSNAISHQVLLESLQPHYNIRRMEIYYCRCSKSPSRLVNASFSKLTRRM